MSDSRRVPPRNRTFNPAALQSLVDRFDDGVHSRAAKRIGISQPTMSKLMSGKGQPRADTIAMAATAYGVSTDWLYANQTREADDTFDMGIRHAVQSLRRELDRLEADLAPGKATFVRPAPRDADVNRRGLRSVTDIPPESYASAKAPDGHVAKKRGRPKGKKRA